MVPAKLREVAMESLLSSADEKYQDTTTSLPLAQAWGMELRLYQGFWHLSILIEGAISAQHNFTAQPPDIVLASTPKSGTTWLKALAFALFTRTRFDQSSSPLLQTVPHECIPFLELDLAPNEYYPTPNKRVDPQVPLLATHMPYTSLPSSIVESGCKIVYIFRDPKDVCVSFWQFMNKDRANKKLEAVGLEEASRWFTEGISWNGPYWEHVLGYCKASLEHPGRILILKYEDMMRDTREHVKKLAGFMGRPFSEEEEKDGAVEKIMGLCSFENLSNLEVNKAGRHRLNSPLEVSNNIYFRKAMVGDWRNYLTAEMAAEIDRITQEKFGSCGLQYP